MKKLTIYLPIIFMSLSLSAQNFNYFDCVWHELGESIGPEFANLRLRISSESTVINEMDYYRVQTSNTLNGDTFFDTPDLVRFSGDQIYEINDFSTDEFLLYDFEANIGDQVSTRNCKFSVVNLDSIQLLDGTLRKQLYMGDSEGNILFYWIEGIGDLKGFLNPRYCSTSENIATVCHYNEDTQIYQNPNFDDCWILSSIGDETNIEPPSIYPNPSSDGIFYIKNVNEIFDYRIYDVRGVCLGKGENVQSKVMVNTLDKGIYIIEIVVKDGVIDTQKISIN